MLYNVITEVTLGSVFWCLVRQEIVYENYHVSAQKKSKDDLDSNPYFFDALGLVVIRLCQAI